MCKLKTYQSIGIKKRRIVKDEDYYLIPDRRLQGDVYGRTLMKIAVMNIASKEQT